MNGIILGNKRSKYPIIQGGMGVGVSLHSLAGNVSKYGGIGVLSAADIGYMEPDFSSNHTEANIRALHKEIKLARQIAGDSNILGINIMVALTDYEILAKEASKAGIDIIFSGAGIPKDLPKYVEGSNTKISPIVSSLKSCKLICNYWIKKYSYVPDMIVIEGYNAGGHLGFKHEEINNPDFSLEKILPEIRNYINDIEKEHNKKIPLIVAGGIWDNADILNMLSLGADGVQLATRFVATEECDASLKYKTAYINAKESDVVIVKSPVGMPGRALNNNFIKNIENNKITKCYNCIKSCNPKTAPYCITKALINAVSGNIDNGLIFCGNNVGKITEITTVKKLLEELTTKASTI